MKALHGCPRKIVEHIMFNPSISRVLWTLIGQFFPSDRLVDSSSPFCSLDLHVNFGLLVYGKWFLWPIVNPALCVGDGDCAILERLWAGGIRWWPGALVRQLMIQSLVHRSVYSLANHLVVRLHVVLPHVDLGHVDQTMCPTVQRLQEVIFTDHAPALEQRRGANLRVERCLLGNCTAEENR
jgi:hypothetical protein